MRYFPHLAPETKAAVLKSCGSALALTLIFASSSAFADTTTITVAGISTTIPNLGNMLVNFASAVPNLMRLVTAGCYVMGMFFMITAIMGMKHLGEMRTMQSREHGFWGPAIQLLVGAAMLYLPTTVQTVMSTFWVDATPYAYQINTGSSAVFVNACYSIVQLIGTIAFIRGLVMLQQAGSERAQPHMMGKALSHLVGGILCINIYGTMHTLAATVGMLG